MSTPADRIRWLAEWSAERRRERAIVRASAIGFTPQFRSKVGRCPRRRRVATELARLQNGLCYLCGRSFAETGLTPTVEHVIPRARGGRNTNNRLAACTPCNVHKDKRWPRPCELLFLEAINLRRGSSGTPPTRPSAAVASAQS